MTGWEVQALKEADDARIWEELNAPDPYEKQMEDSAREMRLAVEMINKAEDYLHLIDSENNSAELYMLNGETMEVELNEAGVNAVREAVTGNSFAAK